MCLPVIGFVTCTFRILCTRQDAKKDSSSPAAANRMAETDDKEGNVRLSRLRVVLMSISIAAGNKCKGDLGDAMIAVCHGKNNVCS